MHHLFPKKQCTKTLLRSSIKEKWYVPELKIRRSPEGTSVLRCFTRGKKENQRNEWEWERDLQMQDKRKEEREATGSVLASRDEPCVGVMGWEVGRSKLRCWGVVEEYWLWWIKHRREWRGGVNALTQAERKKRGREGRREKRNGKTWKEMKGGREEGRKKRQQSMFFIYRDVRWREERKARKEARGRTGRKMRGAEWKCSALKQDNERAEKNNLDSQTTWSCSKVYVVHQCVI